MELIAKLTIIAYVKDMHKNNVILLIVVALLVGFVIGAIAGIKFSSKETPRPVAQTDGTTSENPKIVSNEDISRLQNILKGEPGNLNALIALGNLYFDSNEPQKAIDMYERALKVDPANADVRTDMATMYRNLKDYDKSIKELREAASHNPKHANSRFNLGVVLLHDKKDYKGAVTAWEEFLKVEPTGERADTIRQRLGQLRSMEK
jgi:cytochrome c-type biogenesis protein CcmH/NrfG